MKINWILAVALMAVLGGSAAFAQDGDKPKREGDRPAKGERHDKGDRPAKGERPDKGDRPAKGDRPEKGDRKAEHAEKHEKVRQHIAELKKKLAHLKAKQEGGESEDPERLAEAIKRIEERLAEIKAKLAEHNEKRHGEKGDKPQDS